MEHFFNTSNDQDFTDLNYTKGQQAYSKHTKGKNKKKGSFINISMGTNGKGEPAEKIIVLYMNYLFGNGNPKMEKSSIL